MVKVVGVVVVILVILSVVQAFRGIGNNPAIKNLGDAFGNITGALAAATSYWYLILGAMILGPMVPAFAKWAANRVGDAKKGGLEGKALEAYTDMLINKQAKVRLAETELSPEDRAKQVDNTQETTDRWSTYDKEDQDKAREESKKINGGEALPDPTPAAK